MAANAEITSKHCKPFCMPRMQSSSGHCCLCVVGVFMFLAGVIMISTGVCLILNYGVFDVNLLPPELRNDDGKRTVGIILTTIGFVAILISVLVSVFFLCFQGKTPSVAPNELTQIPETGRKHSNDKTDLKKSAPTTMHSNTVPQNSRMRSKKGKHARRKLDLKSQVSKLEGIKESDAISRKQSEKSLVHLNEVNSREGTPRSNESDNPGKSDNSESESVFGPSEDSSRDGTLASVGDHDNPAFCDDKMSENSTHHDNKNQISAEKNENPKHRVDKNGESSTHRDDKNSESSTHRDDKNIESSTHRDDKNSESSTHRDDKNSESSTRLDVKNQTLHVFSNDDGSVETPIPSNDIDFESQVENLIT